MNILLFEIIIMKDDKAQQYTFKVVLVGNSGVGKSSIITRYIENKFCANYFSNVTMGIFYKDITMDNGTVINLHIWDSSGKERYRTINKLEYQDSQCVIFVYDISNLQSFQSISDFWYKEIIKTVQEDTLLYVVGNKSDLCEEQDVEDTLRDKFLKEKGLKFKEVSACSGSNIKNLFEEIAELLQQLQETDNLFLTSKSINSSLVLSNDDKFSIRSKKIQKGYCCY